MINHNHPTLQNQFLAALLAFTTLAYANVWLMAQSARPASPNKYAVDGRTQAKNGTSPDFSGWSKEKVGAYIVAEAERQLNDPANYIAATAKNNVSVSKEDDTSTTVFQPGADAVSPALPPPVPPIPPTQPLPQLLRSSFALPQQCNTSAGLFEFPLPNDIVPVSFIAPTANGGEFAGVFSLYFAYPQPRVQLLSFGSPALIPARGLVPLDITNAVTGLQARRNLLIYIAQRQNSPTFYDELWIRDTGSDGLFESQGDDRSRLIFSSSNGIQISGRSFPALGNDRLVFAVSVADQQDYVIEVRFSNGITGQLSYEVLPTWRSPFALPQNYFIGQVQVGVQNVGVIFIDPLRGSDVALNMHPGMQGGWNEGDEIFYQIGGGRRGGRPQKVPMIAIAPDDRLAVVVERDSTVVPPFVSNNLIVSDFGPDGIPQTGDPGEQMYTLPATTEAYSLLALGGFAPQGPGRSYPSNSRMSFELNEMVTRETPIPYLRVKTFNFVDIGPDGIYGTSDDVTRSQIADGGFTLRFAEQTAGNAFGVWRKQNADPRTQRQYSVKIYGRQWCY